MLCYVCACRDSYHDVFEGHFHNALWGRSLISNPIANAPPPIFSFLVLALKETDAFFM